MAKLMKRLALLAGVLLLLMLAVSFIATSLFEDEIKAKVNDAVNAHLRSDFSSTDMSLSVFRKFPNASVHLSDVLIKEAIADKVFPDTLLYAQDLFLEFSLFNLFSGDISIGSISASDVMARPGVDETGASNYEFWISDTTSSESTLALEVINISDLDLRFNDNSADVHLSAEADEMTLAGLFNENGNRFELSGEIHFDSVSVSGSNYVHDLPTTLELALEIPNEGHEQLRISKGLIEANQVPLITDLIWSKKGNKDEIVLRLAGNEVDLEGAALLIPELGSYIIEHYGIKGTADLDILYAGVIDDRSMPALDVRMDVREGKLTERSTGVSFHDIALKGGFSTDTKGSMNKLDIHSITAHAGKGKLHGSISVLGTTKASVSGQVRSNIDLSDLFHFAQYEGEIEGQLKLNTEFKGRVDLSDGFSKADMRTVEVIGTADLGHAAFQLAGMRHGFENMNAKLVLNGNDANVQDMNATLIDDRMNLKGRLKGLVNYLLFDDQTLEVVATVKTDHLDLEKAILTTDDEGDESRELVFPKNVNVDLTVTVSEIDYASFHANSVHGQVRIQNGKLVAKPIGFNTSDGQITASLSINTASSGDYPFSVHATLREIDVNQLFTQFDEFGQSFITSQHLKGKMDATIDLKTLLARDMQIDTKALSSKMKISIKQGELIEHAPMIEIADHVRNNALYATFIRADELESRLRHIRFEELSNTIEIKNGKVIIPNMEVRSTAMNVNISGEHGFDDRIDHHVNFRLAELLTRKNKDAEFGEVMDDGTGMRIFLRMYGPTHDLTIENDKGGLAEFRKNRRKERNQELKEIITSPFSGKKDEPKKDSQKTGPIFNVEFDEEENDAPKKKKKGIVKFLSKDSDKEKESVTFTIDDDQE